MKVLRVNFHNFRNEEWFQFFTEYRDLVNRYTPESLDIAPLFSEFLACYAKADEALEVIRKSGNTELMNAADHRRDLTFRGFTDAVKSARNHYLDERRLAAHELTIPLEHYGNLEIKAPDEETAGLYNFIQEMRGRFAPQVMTLELQGWIDELERNNTAYDELVKIRSTETAARTKYRMLDVRAETQNIYRSMIERMEAVVLISANATVGAFVNELNVYLKQRRDIAAQRKAHNND